ncbi:MAG: nitrogen fixation protein NifQ [Sterolibacterium sp.]|nr:nitrogen fixation protein NifQ [Sterolibacterium sp.]
MGTPLKAQLIDERRFLAWHDVSGGPAGILRREQSLPLAETEPFRLDPSLLVEGSELVQHLILSVVRGGNEGTLPLFAATLGLPSWQFAALLDSRSRNLVNLSRFHAELPADCLPELFAPLVQLLLNNRSCNDRISWAFSHALAAACFGHRHLWQDLELAQREDVSSLIGEHFLALFACNTQDLRWKRFLFQKLGQRLGISEFLPPSCDGCEQMQACLTH